MDFRNLPFMDFEHKTLFENAMHDTGTTNPDTRRLLALTANLAVGDGPYPDLAPAYLYSGPYAPILKAATDYWYSNTRAM